MASPSMADSQQLQDHLSWYIRKDDPYSATLAVIAHALEAALSDPTNGAMSESEFTNLASVAYALVDRDPTVRINVDHHG